MPINEDLPDKIFPMKFKWGEEPTTSYLSALSAIKVSMMDWPDRESVLNYLPEYALATWEDKPTTKYTIEQRQEALEKVFKGEVLPTASETMGFTFLVSNIDLIDVTHLIRHRNFSFSAHCTGDRDQRHDDCLVKPSIRNDTDIYREYVELVYKCKKLYSKMVDSKKISILDARTILPRSMANHYYLKCNLRDLIAFFRQRLDKQIQPESDNIIAMKMLVEVASEYPEIKYAVDPDAPDHWFIKTAQQEHSSNLYQPEEKNDIFEWKPQWFVYPRQRSEMSGGLRFKEMWDSLVLRYRRLTR